MRILMLSAPLEIQGPLPKLTPLLMDALRDLGCEVTYESWGRHTDSESLLAKAVGRLGDLFRTRSTLWHQRFDVMVIHTSHEWPALLRDVPLLLSTGRTRPVTVLQFHGSRPDLLLGKGRLLYKFLSGRLIDMCDAVLLLSSEERQHWERLYPARRFYLVSNPFVAELQAWIPPASNLWPVAEDIPVLLFVGRLIREKGIFDLLDAMVLLAERTRCHLLVAGDGVQAQLVRDRVEELGLAERVTIAGYLKGEDLAAAYACATVFVLPTYWPEGFPTVISEAMSMGLPIVTTYIRGVIDHLQEGVNALFVPPRDPVQLAETLLRLLADAGLRRQMSQANQEKVKEFAPQVVGKHYFGVLEEVVGGKSSALREQRQAPLSAIPPE